jgi:hypothetical protein
MQIIILCYLFPISFIYAYAFEMCTQNMYFKKFSSSF